MMLFSKTHEGRVRMTTQMTDKRRNELCFFVIQQLYPGFGRTSEAIKDIARRNTSGETELQAFLDSIKAQQVPLTERPQNTADLVVAQNNGNPFEGDFFNDRGV